MRALQLKVPWFIRYSLVYQKVQSSTGSTLMRAHQWLNVQFLTANDGVNP